MVNAITIILELKCSVILDYNCNLCKPVIVHFHDHTIKIKHPIIPNLKCSVILVFNCFNAIKSKPSIILDFKCSVNLDCNCNLCKPEIGHFHGQHY